MNIFLLLLLLLLVFISCISDVTRGITRVQLSILEFPSFCSKKNKFLLY